MATEVCRCGKPLWARVSVASTRPSEEPYIAELCEERATALIRTKRDDVAIVRL